MIDLQVKLQRIASFTHEDNKYIKKVVKDSFHEDAQVEVSSLNRDNVKIYNVYEYLLKLSRLSYTKVDLYFFRKSKSITNIQRNNSNTSFGDENYEFNVNLWQVFRGYQDSLLVYGDVTQKTIQIEYKKHYSKSSMKIRYIRVRHTETTEKEKQLREIYGY